MELYLPQFYGQYVLLACLIDDDEGQVVWELALFRDLKHHIVSWVLT